MRFGTGHLGVVGLLFVDGNTGAGLAGISKTAAAQPRHRSRYFSHTTSPPSPSLALGIIDFGKPLPLPLLPCARVSPAACAASQELYVLISGVGVCCTGLLVGLGVGCTWLCWDTISSGRCAHVLSSWTSAVCSCWVTVSFQVSLIVIQSVAYWHR